MVLSLQLIEQRCVENDCMVLTADAESVRPEEGVKSQEAHVPRRLCPASKAFWPILHCVDCLCASEPFPPLFRSRIVGWVSWHNQMQHGPFVGCGARWLRVLVC